MIRVNDIPLCVADQIAERYFPVDLAELLFLPQAGMPDPAGLWPPSLPPFRYEFSPGSLYWPQGASRFSLGQYVVTDVEADLIRAIVGEDILGNPVELTLAGQTNQDDALTFQMHVLHMLPLQYHYTAATQTHPRDFQAAVYLLLLVDRRYFWQTHPPTWTITEGTTTWATLETDVEADLGVDIEWDSRSTNYTNTKPGAGLAPPSLASEGVVTSAGALVDAICLATGRRLVANRDGTFHVQGAVDARTDHNLANATYKGRRRYGGDLAFHILEGETVDTPQDRPGAGLPQFVVPGEITLVSPGVTAGEETAPWEVTVTYGTFTGDVSMYTNQKPFTEGELRVGLSGYSTSAGTTLTNYANAWASSWWAFLTQPEWTCYSGVVPFEPDGMTDYTRWVTRQADVYTVVARGPFNPRPGLLHVYLGVAPPVPGGVPTVDVKGGSTAIAAFAADVIDFDGTYTTITESPTGEANVVLVVASSTTGGVLTDAAQDIAGAKTFLATLTVEDSVIDLTNTTNGALGELDADTSGLFKRIAVNNGASVTVESWLYPGGAMDWFVVTNNLFVVSASGQGVAVGDDGSGPYIPSGGGPVVGVLAGANPTSVPTNTAGIFAKSVSGTVKLFGYDGAGTVTQLTP